MSLVGKIMISNMCPENDDLLLYWFWDISKKRGKYEEPILSVGSVNFFKYICDTFEQNSHVFIMAVEIAEDYLRAKKFKKQEINDPVLVAATITFLSHKCDGAVESLKVKHVVDLMFHLTQKSYSPTDVTSMEGDIIITLNGKLPITTTLDDMDIIIEKYMCEAKLEATLRPLCLKILEYVYLKRPKWFRELKEIYSQNKECLNVFRHLATSRFYFPVSILIAAIELTHLKHILDVDLILSDITKDTKIHKDHIRILASKITEEIS